MLELFAANPQCPLLQGGGGGWRCNSGPTLQVVGLAAPHTATRISAPGPAWRPALAQPNLTFRPGHTSRGPTFSWQRNFAVIFTIFGHSQWSMMIFADQCPNFR